ncbi:hypothetical protein ACJQWK_10924 [Exserohilum turcicum]|uniref:Cyanovirin-N domain-containing protein n=1 Tax=Exserohilum turcicum (strain 28A) TaxID=671987 RepID=R0I7R2_EXST2|nr:uncharacterized protein SETTUDRAFT_23974 [Exserohilum turcica Et28A]EOA81585.1 hypothetical protein SETTUDRAFT_23974 [Exserohilum turcica Et28A]
MRSTSIVTALVLTLGAQVVSAAKHDFLICCQRNPSTGVWSPNLALTELVCKALYPNDGEYRQNACYGVHTELYGDDFWTNCRNVGSQDRG